MIIHYTSVSLLNNVFAAAIQNIVGHVFTIKFIRLAEMYTYKHYIRVS